MNPPRKTCRGCGATKPLTDFKAHPHMRDGHLNYCRACTSGADSVAYTKRQAAKGKTHQPRHRYPPAPDGYKYCRHCHQLKPHAAFTPRPTTTNRDGLDAGAAPVTLPEPSPRTTPKTPRHAVSPSGPITIPKKPLPRGRATASSILTSPSPPTAAGSRAIPKSTPPTTPSIALSQRACSRAPPSARSAAHPASPPRTTTITANPWSCAGSAHAAIAAPIANAGARCARRGIPKAPKPRKQDRKGQHWCTKERQEGAQDRRSLCWHDPCAIQLWLSHAQPWLLRAQQNRGKAHNGILASTA
jgi:hypothetical protein